MQTMKHAVTFAALLGTLSLGCATARSPAGVSPPRSPRERISLDDGWRFTKDDPPGNTVSLSYDVRPEVREQRPGAAGARPAATQPAVPAPPVIKAWILPTGNAFIADPARRFVRPAGNWGGDVAYVQAGFDDSSWQQVDLPHDWAIAGPFITTGNVGGMGRLPSWGVGWYRRKLDIPAGDAGKSIFLEVDGAMSYATVWLNGQLVGGWPYGYTSWRVDLTPYVVPGGINQLAIRLDNPPSSSRWYPGGGIYRNVWLTRTQPVHVGQWGTYLTTPQVSSASATVDLRVTVDNDSRRGEAVRVGTEIYALDPRGRRADAAVASIAAATVQVAAGGSGTVTGSATIANPRLWGPPPHQVPNRYVAVTTIWRDGEVSDRYETRFGIRALRFDPDSGAIVNGERVYLEGVNNHHDLGALGAAFNRRAAERQLELLRAMGANALRTSHNPPSPELLELTDSLGFLVLDEAFDVWYRQKTPLDFHLVFADWHEQDLRALLRRDRNHPSVILWSIGNEVGEQMVGDSGAIPARALAAIVRAEDPTRPTTMAMNWSQPQQPFTATVDVIALNYQGIGIRNIPGRYADFRARFPDRVILSSESAAALSSRGEYLFPVATPISNPVRPGAGGDTLTHQVSAYELYAADFGTSADRVFAAQERNPYVAGEFVWSGWDYLGEPTPYYSARSSYFGIIDLAGFPKDRFYLYQSQWRPDLPMAHILPHWTWPERAGQVTPVHVFTSGDAGELFLNGRSLGRRTKSAYEYRLRWDSVVYEPGTLEVVTYRQGARWASDVMKTAGAPTRLELRPDRGSIDTDGRDLAFVTVRVVDASGVVAPRARNQIRFRVDGPGEIVATDNGDPTSFEPFRAAERAAFNGLGLVILRAKPGQVGRITLTASSAGLSDGVAVIQAGTASPLGGNQGAAVTGNYRNLFREAGHPDGAIGAKLDSAWQQLFYGDSATQTVFYWAGQNERGRLAYVSDINNQDVRSEGMSYAMMIAVQLDRKAEFDALWNWSRTYMYNGDPKHPAYKYYSWSMNLDGTPRSESPAPDGEEYWVMALYFASGRWGDGQGIYNYRAMADELLGDIKNRGVIEGPWKSRPDRIASEGSQFNPAYKMVRFTPDTRRPDHTDPSYHLPHFYELWGRWGPVADRPFWLEAAQISRDYFQKVTNPVTGLAPDYANFDGTPVASFGGRSANFGPDAWRTAGNWSVDWSWWAADPREQLLSDRIQAFFEAQGRYGNRYTLDGIRIDSTHSLALVATNAIASLAATDTARARKFVAELWNARIPSGRYRYYDGMWYIMALLHVSGEYRVWTPKGLPKP